MRRSFVKRFACVVGGVVALALGACAETSSSTSPDAGADDDASGGPYGESQALACTVAQGSDPCGQVTLAQVFVATSLEDAGGADASGDAGSSSPQGDGGTGASDGGASTEDAGTSDDAGAVADASTGASCGATGAVRFACDTTGGSVQFDLAADEGGRTQLAAWTNLGSRLVVDETGALVSSALLSSSGQAVRVFVEDGAPLYVSATQNTSTVTIQRPDAPTPDRTHDSLSFGPLHQFAPIASAGLSSDGTLYVVANTQREGKKLASLARGKSGKDAFFSDAPSAIFDFDRAGLPIFVAPPDVGGGVTVVRGEERVTIAAGRGLSPMAVITDPSDRPLVAAFDGGDLAVLAKDDAGKDVEIRIARGTPCGGDGCGYTCEEEAWTVPGLGATWVREASGEPLLVYLEAQVTRARTYTTDSNVPCDIFGGCGCSESTQIREVKDTSVVIARLRSNPMRLVEQARFRAAFDPKASLSDGRKNPVRRLLASVRDDRLHVGVPSGDGSLVRFVVDLTRLGAVP